VTRIDQQINVTGAAQIGVIGDNAELHGGVSLTQQHYEQVSNTVDLAALLPELEQLRDAMRRKADDPEHFEATTEVAKAVVAARKGERSVVVERLGNAGKWALDVARDIGVQVAAEVLARTLR
jgi:hypothetical protein